MANNKTGFDYYNVDTDRYLDKRIKRLKKSFGCTGIAVYDFILSEIYREKGCFITWDEDTAFDVAEYYGLKETTVNEIVQYCCFVGLFNKELLAGEGVLSSHSIQKRFTEMSIRAKRKCYEIPEKIKILTEESTIVQEEPADTSGDLPQSKVKESKEKKNERKEKKNFHPPDLSKSNLFREPVIPTKNEVLECFIQNGGTKEMAKSFYDRNEATGWFFKGSPITNFRNMVGSFVTNWKKNDSGKKEINQDAAEGQRIQEERSREIIGG